MGQRLDKRLSLTVSAPGAPLSLGDEASVTLIVTNTSDRVVEAAALQLPRRSAIRWTGDSRGRWIPLGDLQPGESRTIQATLRVRGLTRLGLLRLRFLATGTDTGIAVDYATLRIPRLPARQAVITETGGELLSPADIARLTFPAGWHERPATVMLNLMEVGALEAGESGRALLLDLSVNDGSPVTGFDAPIQVTLNATDLFDTIAPDNPPVVSTRADDIENWKTLPSEYDPATGELTFSTMVAGALQVGTDPELWKPAYNPPGASGYTGAATYQYPIALPPGISGLTPSLALNYSSRAADALEAPAMSQGFGAGWSLPAAEIVNGSTGKMYTDGGSCCSGLDRNAFTLVLNGVSYLMNPLNTTGRYGTFKAIGGPEIKIEYFQHGAAPYDTTNVSGEFWWVQTPDGTTYTFGQTANSEQVIYPVSTTHNSAQPRNDAFSPYKWKLNHVEDVHGNQIDYTYEAACGKVFETPSVDREGTLDGGQKQCTEVDLALKEIRYNYSGTTAKTIVTFTNSQLNAGPQKQEKSMTAGVFRPAQIDTKHDGQLINRYIFTYEDGAHNFPNWAVSTQFWTLTQIKQFGSNGTSALPAQTFAYANNVLDSCADDANGDEQCVGALTLVDNGYDAVTEIGYTVQNNRWLVVETVDTWDGVAVNYYGSTDPYQTRTKYDHTGYGACYDNDGSVCHMGDAPGSGALVGFDGVVVEVQDSNNAPLSRTRTTFYNGRPCVDPNNCNAFDDSYWLIGKVKGEDRIDPAAGTVFSRDSFVWQQVLGDDQLVSETHELYPNGTWIKNSATYTYNSQATFGGLQRKTEQDETGATVRCTDYTYVHLTSDENWLVNRPALETVSSGATCATKESETLFRYAASNKPSVPGLDAHALLTYILRWDGTNYVQEQRTYTSEGLLAYAYTFDDTVAGNATAYQTNKRRTVFNEYNLPLGTLKKVTTTADDAVAMSQSLTYDAIFPWLPVMATDENGITTGYAYDVFGRLTKVALPGDTLTAPTMTTSYYDGAAPWKVETTWKSTIRSTERTFYDGLGRVVQTQTAGVVVYSAGTKDIITTVAYDARGLEVCRTTPYASAASATFRTATCASRPDETTTTYDALGRVTSVSAPDGAVTSTSYGVKTGITVDGHSRFSRVILTDANNHVVTRFSDSFGRLALVREYTGAGGATAYADTRFFYDPAGNLDEVKTSAASDSQPSSYLRVSTMTYDKLGRKTSMTDPDMGTWNYAYDSAGNLERQQDSAGNVLCFTYDGNDRPLKRFLDDEPGADCPDAPEAGDTVLTSTVYGASNPNNNIGKVVSVDWGPGLGDGDAFTYDTEGRLKTQTRSIDTHSFAYTVNTYDLLDRPTKVTLPNGEVVLTTYDQEGEDTLKAGSDMLISGVGFTALGQLAFLDRPAGTLDTVLDYHGQTENYRLAAIRHGTAGDALPDYGYTGYDAAGNLTGMTMRTGSTTETFAFGYDDLNRLTSASLTNAGMANFSYTYAYSVLGNITSRTGTAPALTYQYGDSLHKQAVTQAAGGGTTYAYTYGTRGNLLTRMVNGVTSTYDFDVQGRLTSISGAVTAGFAYDPDGNRVKAVYANRTVYTPFPDYEVTDNDSDGTLDETRTTYRLAGRIVAVRGAAAKIRNVAFDHLRSVGALFDDTGALVSGSLTRFDPFGNFRGTPPTTNPGTTDHGYTGHRHNNTGPDLGLIYMNARYYLPEVGRFISPDTIVPDPGNPQSYNRYSYTRNNPFNFTDPTGHKECSITCPDDASDWRINTMANHHGEYNPVSQQSNQQAAANSTSTVINFIPGIGDAKGLAEVITGKDLITGEGLGNWRWSGLLLMSEVRSLRQVDDALEVATQASRKRVVIGEGMADVRKAARQNDAKWYQAWSKFFDDESFDLGESLARQDRWIRSKIRQGYEILDIGIDPLRQERSPFYQLELRIIEALKYPRTIIERPK
jgi:RHS repeat-associated protein